VASPCAAAGVYRPRRPTASPLHRLLTDHFDRYRGVYEERYEHRHGHWRSVVDAVVAHFLDCGVLEAGLSYRQMLWIGGVRVSAWLDEEVLAAVPHRQFVFSLPKRLRPYFRWRRKLLGDLARVAAATTTDFIRSTLGEPDLSIGIVLCIQTHGSLLNWQPHVHALDSDGGFRPDGSFVHLPLHRTEVLTEAFRRAVLSLFVQSELFDPETADAMLAWRHSGFSVHDGVWLDQDDRPAHERLDRYGARCPLALDRLDYDAEAGTVTYHSDKATGPTAGAHDHDPLDFIDRLPVHIPDKGQVLQRYYGVLLQPCAR